MANKISSQEQNRFQELLMRVLDQETSTEEKIVFNELINKYPELNSEWLQYQKVKEVIHTMKFKTPPDDIWNRHWLSIYNRIERGIAWILLSVGTIILFSYGIYHSIKMMLADTQVDGIVKIGIIALIIGSVILLVSVLREKIMVYKKDPYKEVH